MAKRAFLIILFCIIITITCSCATNENTYPQLNIAPTLWHADSIYLPLRANHQFAINHLYDEVETDQGYDIIVHVRRESND